MNIKKRPQYIINSISIVYSALCLLPFLLVLSASFTNEHALSANGFKLLPSEFDLTAYEYIFKSPEKILRSYGVTIFVTASTVVGGVLIMSMIGYTLARSNCKFARPLSFYVFFTLLFSGGMVPSYILMTQVLNWKNTYAVMIVPSLVYAFHVIMIRTFFQKLPPALFESAKIDGANEFVIFFRIEQNIQSLLTALGQGGGITVDVRDIPGQNLLMAMAVVAAGPMLVVFPFFQKYFISGLTVGAVKG